MSNVIDELNEDGYSMVRAGFSDDEISAINKQVSSYMSHPHLGIITEDDGVTIRGIHGLHLYDNFFLSLASDHRLLEIAEQYLGSPCYVHQFKINIKRRFRGDIWPWHQDFIYWREKDSIPSPRLLNVCILLAEMSVLSGPIFFIPGSQRAGDISYCTDVDSGSDWKQDVSKNLTYQVYDEKVDELIDNNGFVSITGKAGDLLLFDSLIAHGSSSNLSPYDRPLLIVTYNSIDNQPANISNSIRPEYLCARDCSRLIVREQ